jgi:hypothetical protein
MRGMLKQSVDPQVAMRVIRREPPLPRGLATSYRTSEKHVSAAMGMEVA